MVPAMASTARSPAPPRSWASAGPLIVRDMLCGATRFNDIARGNPRLSRTLLSKRLRQLAQAGIVDHVGDEYLLTPAGLDLRGVVFGLGEWGPGGSSATRGRTSSIRSC